MSTNAFDGGVGGVNAGAGTWWMTKVVVSPPVFGVGAAVAGISDDEVLRCLENQEGDPTLVEMGNTALVDELPLHQLCQLVRVGSGPVRLAASAAMAKVPQLAARKRGWQAHTYFEDAEGNVWTEQGGVCLMPDGGVATGGPLPPRFTALAERARIDVRLLEGMLGQHPSDPAFADVFSLAVAAKRRQEAVTMETVAKAFAWARHVTERDNPKDIMLCQAFDEPDLSKVIRWVLEALGWRAGTPDRPLDPALSSQKFRNVGSAQHQEKSHAIVGWLASIANSLGLGPNPIGWGLQAMSYAPIRGALIHNYPKWQQTLASFSKTIPLKMAEITVVSRSGATGTLVGTAFRGKFAAQGAAKMAAAAPVLKDVVEPGLTTTLAAFQAGETAIHASLMRGKSWQVRAAPAHQNPPRVPHAAGWGPRRPDADTPKQAESSRTWLTRLGCEAREGGACAFDGQEISRGMAAAQIAKILHVKVTFVLLADKGAIDVQPGLVVIPDQDDAKHGMGYHYGYSKDGKKIWLETGNCITADPDRLLHFPDYDGSEGLYRSQGASFDPDTGTISRHADDPHAGPGEDAEARRALLHELATHSKMGAFETLNPKYAELRTDALADTWASFLESVSDD